MRWLWALLAVLSIGFTSATVAPSQNKSTWATGVLEKAMTGVQGAAVVLDVESGRLVAGYRMDVAARRLTGPGSTIKPFTLLALMDAGLVNSETSLMCGRTVRISGHGLDCSHVALPEPVNAVAALAYSCNYFFTQMAQRLQGDALVRTLVESGFTSPSGLVQNEASGIVRRPATREAVQLMAVGEEGVQITPLGLAAVYRKLALRVRRGEAKLTLVVDGMQAAARFGTAQLAKPEVLSIAGKTGTTAAGDGYGAQAWFAGFAPAGRPEIVVVIFLERGSGGGDAAPIARRVFEAYP